MYFSDRITLRAESFAPDSYGQMIASYTDTVVFANKKSATRSEFYQANANGINIVAVFEVHVEDYDNQAVILSDTAQYDVVRAYQAGEGTVELNCTLREVLYAVTFTVLEGAAPVENATITFNGESKSTDSSGEAVFRGISIATSQAYTVTKTGYTTVSDTVDVAEDTAESVALVAEGV
jgi:SPP1 family predicted phage head-tail adaptor